MRKFTATTLIPLAVVLLGGSARAQHPSVTSRPGFDLGVRLGYAIPFGDVTGDANAGLASTFSGAIPFVLEGGYRLNEQFTVGALFQYGVAQIKSDFCGNGFSCSGSIIRFGFEGLYHFPNPGLFAPWAGAGIGYEWMNVDFSGLGGSASAGASGVEFLTLQGGAEYRAAPQFTLGPFASFSLARYGTVDTSGTSRDVTNPAMHEWLQIGVRGSFNL